MLSKTSLFVVYIVVVCVQDNILSQKTMAQHRIHTALNSQVYMLLLLNLLMIFFLNPLIL